MADLKRCPFCGGKDIRYSLKITGHFDVRYHAAMYCNKCHCYGARTLTKTVRCEDYKGRTEIENNAEVKAAAIEAWNRRYTPSEIEITPFEVGDTIHIPLPKDKKIMTYNGVEIDFDYEAED